MKKTILVFLVFIFSIISTNASANSVTVYIDGVNSSDIEICGFEFTFFSPDSSDIFSWPVGKEDPGTPPDFRSDFFVNGEISTSAGGFGLDAAQPHEGDYWYIDTLIDDNDNDGYEYVRGLFGFDDYDEPDWNKLNDGLLLTMSSNNTDFAIDILHERTYLYGYYNNNAKLPTIITETWTDGNQIVTISPVPIPATAFLFASGFLGLLGIRRKVIK